MEIEEFTADDTAVVGAAVAVDNAVQEVDSPWSHPSTVTTFAGMMRHGWDGETPRCLVARAGDRVLGHASFWIGEWDNTDLAWFDIVVHPKERRSGVGSALVESLRDLTRQTGRTKIGADGWDSEATYAFAGVHGFEKKSQAINRRQFLAEVDRAYVEKLHAEAAEIAADYELLRITGPTPDDLMDKVATMTAAINDAPLDDLDIEDEVFPPERVRGYENATIAKGQRLYRLVAQHRGTGELAGHTIVAVEGERPRIGHQHDTSVVRDHRGHRLGLLLKAGMLLWLADAEPQLETVDTWNAESNDHMIAVNEQLGYRVMGRGLQFQRTL
ncbi:MAG: GNAT family N-acetyltransferase [Nocardioides sp.]